MNLKETYNKIALDWHYDHKTDNWWTGGVDKFISMLPKNARVLDVGCGSGVKSAYLLSQGLQVVGVDISENLLEIARKEVPQAEFIELDMRDLSKLTHKFDAIFSQASLLHIQKSEIKNVLSGLMRLLKQGGFFYIALKAQRPGQPEEIIYKENDYGYDYERFFSFYTLPELRGYLKDLNLQIVYEDEKNLGKTTWIQIVSHS